MAQIASGGVTRYSLGIVMHVLVLGAYGLIGSAVAARLEAAGHEVTGLGRDVAAASRRAPNRRWIALDLRHATEPKAWQACLDGIDAVVNCAGALQDGPEDDLDAVHHRAPLALYRACASAGIRRIVHISAAGVGADRTGAFAATKHRLESALATHDASIVILRPGLVIAPMAYGGSALLRGLAGMPLLIPAVAPATRIQVISIDDITQTVSRAIEGAMCGRYDLVHPQVLTLGEILTRLRAWLGWPPAPLVPIPPAVARLVARLADGLSRLGWRSPMRSAALAELDHGVLGDGSGWRETFAIEPRPLADMLAQWPAGAQERWFSRLYLLKPLAIGALSLFWIASGLVAILQFDRAARVLTSVGIDPSVSDAAVAAGSILDIALGTAILGRRMAKRALVAMALVPLVYLAAGTVLRPDLWIDPLGPFLKVIPAAVLALSTMAILDDR